MKRRMGSRMNSLTIGAGFVGAVVLISSSFAVASGADIARPNTYVAAAVAALSGDPIVKVVKDASSPNGSITTGASRTIAVYNISVSKVTHFARAGAINIEIPLSGAGAAQLNLTNIAASYRYCIPSGVTYGYGYQGGACGNVPMLSSFTREGNTYKVTVYGSGYLLLYPQQSSGLLTVMATPKYAVGGNTTATLRTVVASMFASGDQCKPDGKGGYTNCVSKQAQIVLGSSNKALKVLRSYGFGYCLI